MLDAALMDGVRTTCPTSVTKFEIFAAMGNI